jgi:hypothetical protein
MSKAGKKRPPVGSDGPKIKDLKTAVMNLVEQWVAATAALHRQIEEQASF